MSQCKKEVNLKNCNCSFSCGKKGVCCDCISYHRSMGELPGCYFPADIERKGERSIEALYTIVQERGTGYLR